MDILSFPKKVAHASSIELRSVFDLVRYGVPDVMLQFGGGLGDELYLTAVAHELHKRDPLLKIWQVSHSAGLLLNNPDYHKIFSWDQWYLRYSKMLNGRRLNLSYTTEIIPRRKEVPPSEHVIKILCRKAGVTGPIEIRPYFHFDQEEIGRLPRIGGQVAVQCLGKDSYPTVWLNKLWDSGRFQSVVDALRSSFGFTVVQLGTIGDPPLRGVVDLRGKNSLRDDAAVIHQSEFFLGLEGFLMHLSRAVNRRSVIVFGGRIHSRQTGYTCNENLDSFVECAPCWQWYDCDYERKCMTMITADHVLAAVERLLSRKDDPLEADITEIE